MRQGQINRVYKDTNGVQGAAHEFLLERSLSCRPLFGGHRSMDKQRIDSRISGDAEVRIGTGARYRLPVPSQRGRQLARFPLGPGLCSRKLAPPYGGRDTHTLSGVEGVLIYFVV